MKGGPFDTRDSFLDTLDASYDEVAHLSDADVDAVIARDQRRLRDYDRAQWTLDRVDLHRCHVWPRMGERPWAEGTVMELAPLFYSRETTDSRIWRMMDFAETFASRLPIIVLTDGTTYRIDDGSHRAVAMALKSISSPLGWIGRLGA